MHFVMGFRICCYNKLWMAFDDFLFFFLFFPRTDGMDSDGQIIITAFFIIWSLLFLLFFSSFILLQHAFSSYSFLLQFFLVSRISSFSLLMMMITPLRF